VFTYKLTHDLFDNYRIDLPTYNTLVGDRLRQSRTVGSLRRKR